MITNPRLATAGVVYMSYPLFTIVMVWILFRQPPTGRAVVAGVVVLAAARGPTLRS